MSLREAVDVLEHSTVSRDRAGSPMVNFLVELKEFGLDRYEQPSLTCPQRAPSGRDRLRAPRVLPELLK